MNEFFDSLKISPKIYLPIMFIIIAFITYIVLSFIIKKILKITKISDKRNEFQQKREATIIILLQNVIKYVITIITILSILGVYGVDTRGIIASIGVGAAIMGLAFQDIIKNFLSGISIVFDNHYMQGDIVTINDFKGEVIELGLQTTKIRKYTGEVMIIDNSKIDNVINHSMYDTNHYITIPVDKKVPLNKIEEMLNNVAKKIKKMDEVKGEVNLLGIDNLEGNKYSYILYIECYKNKHYAVNREFMKLLKEEYDKNKIKVPGNFIEIINK